MKKNIRTNVVFQMISTSLLLVIFASCNKENSLGTTPATTTTTSAATTTAVASTQAVAVAASRHTPGDSVYVVGTCDHGHSRDSIAFSNLPAAITNYLTTNYAGYTFQKSYTDKDTSGNVAGYIVIIQYNNNPVGLKFNSTGAFVKVLEQREGHDLEGHGWHHGGDFDDRDGLQRDTIAISALPSGISNYLTTNYAQDTLLHAYKNRDSSIVVLSANNGLFATVFDASGTFIKRVELPSQTGQVNVVQQAALPSTIQTYLTTTYPNYVFKQAFQIIDNGTLQGYAVFIDANETKYALAFDASGNVIKTITVR